MDENNSIQLFEDRKIRTAWDEEQEEWYFSVQDVIAVLAESSDPKQYIKKKRARDPELSANWGTICTLVEMKAKDGKIRKIRTADTKGILRLIESIPSPKAEPFKLWLAKMGNDRIDEVFDPELAINRAVDYYRSRGYDDNWIKTRMTGVVDIRKLTDVWKENGIENNIEYAILTNEIYKEWSGMTAKEYKQYKGLRKESLRDNMDNIELILTDLSEEATKRLAAKQKPNGLKENIKVAKMGGHAAKVARDDIEKNLGESVVTKSNKLNYKYIEDEKTKKISDKNEDSDD